MGLLSEKAQPKSWAPNSCFTESNVGIAMAYFSVGLVMSFVSTPLSVYMVEVLDAEPKMQTTMGILQTLPWSLKLIFGFLSDAVPILGMHRKPYLALGALCYSASFLTYAILGFENVLFLAICMFLGTLGLITMDVMCDTMCVERSRFELDAVKGQMQATYYTVRFGGGIIGSFAGALLYNKESWGWGLTFRQIAFINGMIPLCLVAPSLFWLVEKYKKHRLADGRRIVVPFNYDTSMLTTYKSVGFKLSSLANEETPLLQNKGDSSSSKHAKSGMSALHPTTEVSVAHHAAPASVQQQGVEMKAKRAPKGSTAGDGSDSDGSDDLETGLQLEPMLRPGPGQVKGVGLPSMALESHVHKHPHHHQHHNASGELVSTEDGKGYGALSAGAEAATTTEAVTDIDDDDEEDDDSLLKAVMLQLDDIWNTVQLKAVWRPMAFVYVFNIMQTPNVAWQSYLQLTLHFEPFILGMMVAVGSIMTFAGVVAYKYLFFKVSWRKLYVWSTVLVTIFGLLQLTLIAQWNVKYLHMNNYFFSLGDDVISSYISGIQFLPLCIMYMKLCPEGSEGASYSMLTTFSNIAVVCASNVGNLMSNIWDVSNDAMKENRLGGLWNLTILTSVINVFPLLLLRLLPNSAEEQEELSKCKDQSRTGGIVFLCILFGSIAWSFGTAIFELVEV